MIAVYVGMAVLMFTDVFADILDAQWRYMLGALIVVYAVFRIRRAFFTCLLPVILLITSCGNPQTDYRVDTPTNGTASIAVDESFQPVITEAINVFESIYPQTGIFPIYAGETDVLNLLLRDSVHFAIATRTLTAEERASLESRKLFAQEIKIATDGIALLINKANKDSLISLQDLRRILTGKATAWSDLNPKSTLGDIRIMFDHPRSGTVRFLMDSVCRGENLSNGARSRLHHAEVVDFVSQTPGALGIIGVNWVSNHRDTTCMGFLDKVRIMAVSREAVATADNSFQPYQAYLATEQYPLRRDVYVLLTDPRHGLPAGFTSFLASDRGQRIILKSGILPATIPLRIIQVIQ